MNILSYQAAYKASITKSASVAATASASNGTSFTATLKSAFGAVSAAQELPKGNVSFTRQSLNYAFDVDMSKSKDAMTLDEYKMYALNKFSQINVSAFTMTHVFGPITVTEECFERMKADEGFESIVFSTMRMELTTTMCDNMPACYGDYTFGGTVDEIRGTAYSIDAPTRASNKKSYWEIRMEKIKEALREARKKADEGANSEDIYQLLCGLMA